MPSFFPGMDPFLEHPSYFPGLHASLNFIIHELLQHLLPEPYFAVLNERLWVETSERYIEPDVDVLPSNAPSRRKKAGLLKLSSRSPPIVITIPHDEVTESYVEIRTRTPEGERVVTTMEVLSLTNKTPGDQRRAMYLRKQAEILNGDSHLVEIDLLRGGTHTTAPPRWRIEREAGAFDYHVSVHHFDALEEFYVYPVTLQQCLPEIAVPLLPGDGHVPLDLQTAFGRCYDAGPYRRRVKYDVRRIVPPLTAKQARWARSVIRSAKDESRG